MLAASPGSLQGPEKSSEECRRLKANGTGGEINGQKAVARRDCRQPQKLVLPAASAPHAASGTTRLRPSRLAR
jgi:hypothetical protein